MMQNSTIWMTQMFQSDIYISRFRERDEIEGETRCVRAWQLYFWLSQCLCEVRSGQFYKHLCFISNLNTFSSRIKLTKFPCLISKITQFHSKQALNFVFSLFFIFFHLKTYNNLSKIKNWAAFHVFFFWKNWQS